MATPAKAPTADNELDVSYDHLHRTLRDHIDRRAIELGVFAVTRTDVELRALVVHVVAGAAPYVRARVAVQPGSTINVHGDPSHIARAVLAVLHASAASAVAGSSIDITLVRRGPRAVIGVTSTFHRDGGRQHDPLQGNTDAVQLALFVADHAIAAHGGRLGVVDKPGSQAMMTIDLPLPLPGLAAPRTTSTVMPAPRVLIVEDNLEQIPALLLLLRSRGFVPDVATSGGEALLLAAARAPDVLVVDGKLPDTTPATLIQRIRKLAPETPAILVTGYPIDHSLVIEALALGHTKYLAKPMDVTALFHELRRARE
jgi:CheY-like chemotaxis protein